MRQPPRAFALVIVAVAGVAITAVALALVFTAGSNRILSAKGGTTDRATNIAESGLERAMAYLRATARAELDFDRVLDPALSSACEEDVLAEGLPRYSDGTRDNTTGVPYLRVDFNGGSYFTRVDDDADDTTIPLSDLAATTSNNRLGTTCTEGPTTNGGSLTNPGNNPHRDRNRTVWLTVIGVAPAGPLAAASQRIALRRLYVAPDPAPTPVVSIGGKLDVDNNGLFEFCSDQGGIAVGDVVDLQTNADLENCGSLVAGGAVTGTPVAPTCPAGIACTPHGATAQNTGAARPTTVDLPPVVAQLGTQAFTSGGNSPCNFLLVPTGDAAGVYYWDATGTRATGACSDANPAATFPLPGPLVTAATPAPLELALQGGSTCWVPLLIVTSTGAVSGVASNEVSLGQWRPRQGGGAWDRGVSGAALAPGAGHAWSGAVFSDGPFAKPDWGACGVHFRPPETAAPSTCSGVCDGSNAVLSHDGAGFVFLLDNKSALPPGIYIHDGSLDVKTTGGTTPINDGTAGEWPLITLLVRSPRGGGAANVNFGVGRRGFFGVGTTANGAVGLNPTGNLLRFPSLLVGGSLFLDNGADATFGGSVYVRGDVEVRNTATLTIYGQVAVGGELRIRPNGELHVWHDDAFAGGTGEHLLAQPSTSKTLR